MTKFKLINHLSDNEESKLNFCLSINDRIEDAYTVMYQYEDEGQLYSKELTLKRIKYLESLVPSNLKEIIDLDESIKNCKVYLERDRNIYYKNKIKENLDIVNISIEIYNEHIQLLKQELLKVNIEFTD